MVSSTSRPKIHSSLPLSAFASHEWSRHVYRLLVTTLVNQCHREYVTNLAGERRNGEHSVVGSGRYRFRHHEGNKPSHINSSRFELIKGGWKYILPSLQHTRLLRSHCPALIWDCSLGSLATRIGQRHPSYAQSFPGLAAVL